ncbi:MAG TPA: hypothetical protein DCS67_01330 [Clostridiales bacterium UBA8960]|nr:hypothetical protein [Clostridiales bacterium UBA8960]
MIYARKDSIVATAEMLFNLSEVKMAVLEVTEHQTAMGRVIIGRTLSDGYVQVGGPASNAAIRDVSEKMLLLGARYVLVDGALDRTSSASPAITDACILSTGAVVSRDMSKTVEQTAYRASLFKLKEIGNPSDKALWDIAETLRKPILVDDQGGYTVLADVATALSAGRHIAENMDADTRTLIIPGALVTQTVMDVIQTTPNYKNLTWIIGDATKIFIDHKDWLYFMRIGVRIEVRYAIKLLAITVNPYAPSGYFYDSERFKIAIEQRVDEIPVIDVMA